jgi:hypothetical protein
MSTFFYILGVIVTIAAIIALCRNICAIYYNATHFWNGGIRITYKFGEYEIISGKLEDSHKMNYRSSGKSEDYIIFRSMGMLEYPEIIPPFMKWNKRYWHDDIRVHGYEIKLLKATH